MQIKVTKKLAGLGLFAALSTVLIGGAALAVDSSPLTTPTDSEQSMTMVQRISERQSVLKLKLTAAQKKLLTTRCAAAQTKLQVLKTQDSTAAGKRQQIYSDLASRLEDIIVQLKVQGVDTTQLSTAQKNFNAAIDLYLADAMSYRAALDDAATIDCQTDPTGFEASLLSARQLRVQLAADVSKIKAIRPQLVKNLDSLKLQLSANTQRAGQ